MSVNVDSDCLVSVFIYYVVVVVFMFLYYSFSFPSFRFEQSDRISVAATYKKLVRSATEANQTDTALIVRKQRSQPRNNGCLTYHTQPIKLNIMDKIRGAFS